MEQGSVPDVFADLDWPVPPLPVIFCFAGQGSQYFGMAGQLLAENAVFRHWMLAGDAIVAARHGFSVLAEIQGGGKRVSQPFDRMEASHPAIFLVQYALAKVLQDHGLRPHMLLGVSLGEIVAQAIAGMISFEAALTLVADQPNLFRRTCPPGGMVAVLAPATLHADNPVLAARSEMAGITSPNHFILSALAEDLDEIEAELRRREVVFQRLPVPFAFHSRFIDAAQAECLAATALVRRETPFWPVWSCCTAGLTGTAMPDLIWRIVRQPMRVAHSVAILEQQGAVYVDLSPSGTLATVLRQCLQPGSPSKLLSVLSPFGGDDQRLTKTVETLRRLAETGTLR
ncbi:putative enzyme involved in polyketide synthesis [Magnetospirillum gryphiswaldense MSR-1 v2]|uniref:Enzyme involved in polyketide synthesis n=1 Tax=Magnetospirillum gryphiswaldense (strain DSM 6361 / JCM 21280 / NBRC 15271 / MSR-1) TaxID=431944 RepID=V6F063_MAGGM|nr:putative enzyme involved in polyketide synthesis [Magnetospirillum gryphiswaldense MSR-1 v2]